MVVVEVSDGQILVLNKGRRGIELPSHLCLSSKRENGLVKNVLINEIERSGVKGVNNLSLF